MSVLLQEHGFDKLRETYDKSEEIKQLMANNDITEFPSTQETFHTWNETLKNDEITAQLEEKFEQ